MRSLAALGICIVLSLVLGTSRAEPLTASNNTSGSVDDSRFNRSLIITGSGTIADVDIRVDFSHFEAEADAFLYLTSPGGTRVDLVYTNSTTPEGAEQGSTKPLATYPSALNGARINVTFDDEALAPVGPGMATGRFRPEELLAAFDGQNAMGTWTLTIGDSVALGGGTSYFSSTLTITVASVPEPSTLAILFLALAGLGAFPLIRVRS